MSKHYTLDYSKEYYSNGCDCCEPTEWDNYNCEDFDPTLGSCSSVEEAELAMIIDYLYRLDARDLSEEQRFTMLDLLGITYEIKKSE